MLYNKTSKYRKSKLKTKETISLLHFTNAKVALVKSDKFIGCAVV